MPGKIGIIGGMGPLATAVFYAMLTNGNDVKNEQEHPDIIIYSKPSVPDRSAFILGKSETSPAGDIIQTGLTLQNAGANVIAMPCVTSHFFYDELATALDIPVINILDEVVNNIRQRGFKKVGLLATDGTIVARLLHDKLENHDIETLVPDSEKQEILMDTIYQIKCGRNIKTQSFDDLEEDLFQQGAESVILGCTELSLVIGPVIKERVDVLETLAGAVLRACIT